MNSLASLNNLPRGLFSLRAHYAQILAAQEELERAAQRCREQIATLAAIEINLWAKLAGPIDRFDGDFDAWFRDEDFPPSEASEFAAMLDKLAGRQLAPAERARRLERAWVEIVADMAAHE